MRDNFGENLKKMRQELKMTQAEVATKIGVAKNTYSNYENGLREPNILTIKALAKLFGVTVDYLVGMEKDPALYELRNKYGDENISAYIDALKKLTESKQ